MKVMLISEQSIRLASEVVSGRGLVVYPTDTVYGLGCDPFDSTAVGKVYRAKRREDVPVPVLGSRLSHLERMCVFNDAVLTIADVFWPGHVTFVLPARTRLPVSPDRSTVGVRIPSHDRTRRLLEECGGLLVGTSANITGRDPPSTVEEAVDQLGDSVDLYLDGGEARGIPSTVVDVTGKRPVLLREGVVEFSEILRRWEA